MKGRSIEVLSGNDLDDSRERGNQRQGGHANLQQGNKQRRGLTPEGYGSSRQRQK